MDNQQHNSNQEPQDKQAPRETPRQQPFVRAEYQAIPKKKKASKASSFFIGLLGGLVGSALIALSFYAALNMGYLDLGYQQSHEGQSAGQAQEQKAQQDSKNTSFQTVSAPDTQSDLAEQVSKKALPSVVSIDVVAQKSGRQVQGVGSGVILDKEGHIITNNHVITGAISIKVSVGDKVYEGSLVGSDPSSDLAVVKIEADDLSPIVLADSDAINVGQWVMAIGSPFGLEQSVSTGIVSSLYRSTTMRSYDGYSIYANLIQTDAAINPGNSGGALVNNKAELIGINTLIESASGSSAGVGFAIPINYAKRVVDQIIAGEPVSHAFLGVTLNTVTAQNYRSANLATKSGAYVVSVIDQGPAALAGIKEGDVITAIDGKAVLSADDLILKVRAKNEGDTITVSLMRGQEKLELSATLGSDSQSQESSTNELKGKDQNNSSQNPFDLYEYYNRLLNK